MLKLLRNFAVELWRDEGAWVNAALQGAKFALPFIAGLFKKKQQQQSTQNVDLTDTRDMASSGSTRRTFSGPGADLANPLVQATLANLNAPTQFNEAALDNLQLQQGAGVSSAFEGAGRNAAASARARGMQFSPGYQAVQAANLQGARGGALSQIAQNIAQQKFEIPMLQQRLRESRIRTALPVLGQFAGTEFDQTGTSTNRRTGTTTTTGSGSAGGGPGGGVAGLGWAAGHYGLPNLNKQTVDFPYLSDNNANSNWPGGDDTDSIGH